MNIQSILVLIIIAIVAILILRNIHKNGANTCGGSCSSCSMNCSKRDYSLKIKDKE